MLPAVTVAEHLPTSLAGDIRGDRHDTLTIGHLPGADGVAVSSVKASLSYDDGRTWRPATVTREHSGVYALDFTVPPFARTNGFGALRLRAVDAEGNAVSQSVTRAFAVTP